MYYINHWWQPCQANPNILSKHSWCVNSVNINQYKHNGCHSVKLQNVCALYLLRRVGISAPVANFMDFVTPEVYAHNVFVFTSSGYKSPSHCCFNMPEAGSSLVTTDRIRHCWWTREGSLSWHVNQLRPRSMVSTSKPNIWDDFVILRINHIRNSSAAYNVNCKHMVAWI